MSNTIKTFVDSCLDGEALAEDIDNFVDRWHETDSDETLAEFLGLRENEYSLWVNDPQIIRPILCARKRGLPFYEVLRQVNRHTFLAARGQLDEANANAIMDWLIKTGRITE